MSILKILSEVVSPITNLIDDLHTSDEEKLELKAKMLELHIQLSEREIEYNSKLADAQGKAVEAEAKGESFLQRNWRPVTMLTFVFIIVARMFGLTNDSVSEAEYIQLWSLMEIGLGGYIVGRTAEKVGPKIMKAFRETK